MSLRFLSLVAAMLLLSLSAAQAQQKAKPADDPVVARVNGVELHRSDVVAMQHALPPQYQQVPLEQIYPQLLDQVVTSQLITQEARKEKLADDPEVKQRVAQIEARIIQDVWLKHEVAKAATDKRMHEEYDRYVKEKGPTEQVKASHILVGTEAEAKAIIAQLDKGADFATLAKEHSTDPSKDNGGDLGYFSREDMVPAFTEAAFKLKKGEYTKTPVQTEFGWHVIKVEDRRTGQPSFEEAKPELMDAIAHEVVDEKLKALKGSAKIQTFNLDGSPTQGITLAPSGK